MTSGRAANWRDVAVAIAVLLIVIISGYSTWIVFETQQQSNRRFACQLEINTDQRLAIQARDASNSAQLQAQLDWINSLLTNADPESRLRVTEQWRDKLQQTQDTRQDNPLPIRDCR